MKNRLLLIALVSIFFVGAIVLSTYPGEGDFISRTQDFFNGTSTSQSETPEPEPASDGQQPQAVRAVSGDDWVRGDLESAQVILVEYADLQCVFCAQFHQTMQEVMAEFDGEVAWVYRHYPLLNSQLEAESAECVGRQGGTELFWQFVDAYYQNRVPTNITRSEKIESLVLKADEFGVDISECLELGHATKMVEADFQNAKDIGLQGTPSTVVIIPETEEYEILAGAYATEDMISILGSYLR